MLSQQTTSNYQTVNTEAMYKYTIFRYRPFPHSMPFCSTILDIQHIEIKLTTSLVLPKEDPNSGPQTTFRVPLPFWATEWSDTEIFDKIPFSWEKRKQENLQKTITGIWLKKFYARLLSTSYLSNWQGSRHTTTTKKKRNKKIDFRGCTGTFCCGILIHYLHLECHHVQNNFLKLLPT